MASWHKVSFYLDLEGTDTEQVKLALMTEFGDDALDFNSIEFIPTEAVSEPQQDTEKGKTSGPLVYDDLDSEQKDRWHEVKALGREPEHSVGYVLDGEGVPF
jgi:hypothetical protein